MKIVDVKINGMTDPIGFDFSHISLSWIITGADDASIVREQIELSTDASFLKAEYTKAGAGLNRLGEELAFRPAPRTRYYVRVTAETADGEIVSSPTACFESAKMDEGWAAKWIRPVEADTFHPLFLKDFRLDGAVRSARIYTSGLGMYYAELNGSAITDEVLTPYYSDYHTEIQYQTFDITPLLRRDNRLEVMLGNGWYKGRFGLKRRENNFGSCFLLIAELHIVYEDGRETVICTDDTWRYRASCIESGNIYDGESVNRLTAQQDAPLKAPIYAEAEGKLVERYSLPVREKEELPVQRILNTPARETVLDFGQNFAGYVVFRDELPKGTKIVLDFGEILQDGNFYNANYRKALSRFTYVADGSGESVKPRFTFFGFRYCRVTGWPEDVPMDSFAGKAVYSDMPRSGSITTGNAKLNRLFLNALWGQKSNSIDFPTDCPQRDERLGWTGDAQVFAGTACYNMDASAFYGKFAHDLRTEQQKYDGILPGVIPVLEGQKLIFSSVWGDIATFLPTVLYEHYGDRSALRAQYPMMKDWVDKITREDQRRGQQFLFNFGSQLGDWLALDGRTEQSMSGGTDEYYIGSHYYAMSVQKLANAAGVLGRRDEAAYYSGLYQQIRSAILKEYFTPSGRLCVDTQTGYLVALSSGIYPDRRKVVEGLRTRLYRDCFKLKGGFVGAPIMCKVMAENGMEEEALYFLLQEDYPGWLHCVNLGATTIWERWNSVLDNGKLSGTTMNSLNHYAYGAVVEFLYRGIAGLTPTAPGFRRIRFAPVLSNKLGYMSALYRSRSGEWHTHWEICRDGHIHVELTVPFGCSADIVLPYYPKEQPGMVSAGAYVFDYAPTQDMLRRYTEHTLFRDMMQDAEAMEAIKACCPILDFYLSIGDEETKYETLSTLLSKEYMGFHEPQITALKGRLLQLRCEKPLSGDPSEAAGHCDHSQVLTN